MSEKKLPEHNESMRHKNLIQMAGCVAAENETDSEGYRVKLGDKRQYKTLEKIKKEKFEFYKAACGHCAVADCEYRYGERPNLLAKTLKNSAEAHRNFRRNVKSKTSYDTFTNSYIDCKRQMQKQPITDVERYKAKSDIFNQMVMGEAENDVEYKAEQKEEIVDSTSEKVSVKLAGPNQFADADSDWNALMAEEQRMDIEFEEENPVDSTLYIQDEAAQITMDDLMNS